MDNEVSASTFGAFDGATSVLGVIFGLGIAHRHMLLLAVVGLAVSSAVGMAGGEFLAENDKGWRAAATIGVATAVGTILPVIPLVTLGGTWAILAASVVILAVGAAISVVRGNHVKHWAQTFVILGLAAGASILAAIVLGGTG